jgi:hypothetical protein
MSSSNGAHVPESRLHIGGQPLSLATSTDLYDVGVFKLTDTKKMKLTPADIKANLAKVGVPAAEIQQAFKSISLFWASADVSTPPTAQLGACGSW